MLILSLRLAVVRNVLARLRCLYLVDPSLNLRIRMAHAVRAVRQARAAIKIERQARQAAFVQRCQAAAAKRQAAAAKRTARKAARNGKLTAKEVARLARERMATLRLKAAEERQAKVRRDRQALQMAIGAERIRRAKQADEKRRKKIENRLTTGKRIAE